MQNETNTGIIKQKIVYEGKLVVEEGKLSAYEKTFTRQRLNRENAVAILLLNTDSNKIILTRQFRYAIAAKTTEPILEIVAGKIEGEDSPEETAKREVEEETGYRIIDANLKLLMSCFASPGYSSEQFFIYYATVANSDKVSEGGGLKEENEHIQIIELEVDDFTNQVRDGMIKDAKTYIAGLFMILQWH